MVIGVLLGAASFEVVGDEADLLVGCAVAQAVAVANADCVCAAVGLPTAVCVPTGADVPTGVCVPTGTCEYVLVPMSM